MNFLLPSKRRRRGSVMVMVTLSMVALLGGVALSVDYGRMVMDANRLQRGCDAAALAAADKLKRTSDATADRNNAATDAWRVAWQNDHVPVNTSQGDVTFSNNDSTVTVRSTTTRSFLFAPVLGIKSGQITRWATAQVRPVSSLSTNSGPFHVAPIGITWETYNSYKNDQTTSHDLTLVRQNKTTFGLNDLVLFDLRDSNAKSGAHMEDQLTGSENDTVNLNDYETTLNAASPSETGKLGPGLDTLFAQAAGSPWFDTTTDSDGADQILNGTLARDDPRVVYLIITPSTSSPNNGTFNTQVQGFVPVYLESYNDNGNVVNGKGKGGGSSSNSGFSVRMRFLPASFASGAGLPTSTDTTTSYSGLSVVNLTG